MTVDLETSPGMPRDVGSSVNSPSEVAPGYLQEARWERARNALRSELGELRAALLMQGVANVLPQFCFNRLRTALWRAMKFEIGSGSLVMGDLILSGSGDWRSLFEVGSDTYISGPLRINLGGAVRIGSGVNIGHDCLLLTVDHEMGGPERRAGTSTHKPIVIEDGAWIASRVVVLPGVTVGSGAVVAAGTVVTKDVPPHTLVAGIPSRVIRQLPR